MGEAEREIAPIAAAATQAMDQEAQESMQPLLSRAQVANAQQLQGPLIDRVKAASPHSLGVAAEDQRSQGLHAHTLTAEPIGAELIAGLEEGQGHPLGLLTGAIDASHALEHLDAAATGMQSRIEQDGLPDRHPHGTGRGVREKAEGHDPRKRASCECVAR